ncbi:MAG: hypothetical protein ACREVC_15420 [Burkholderiales bacterium]
MLADVFQHLAEVRQFVEQFVHLRHRRGLDGEALAAYAQHLLVQRAQRFARGWRELLQGLVDVRDAVDVLETRDRDCDVCRHYSISSFFGGMPARKT